MGVSSRVLPMRRTLVLLLLTVASVAQVIFLGTNYIIPWAKATWRSRDLSSMDRSALFFLGRGGWNYMAFLDSAVPERSPVALTPGGLWFSQQSVMQFYLMPRGIVGCPCNEDGTISSRCAQCLNDASRYVPAIGEYPPQELLGGSKVLIPFVSKYAFYKGVFGPVGASLFASPGRLQPSASPLVLIANIAEYACIVVAGWLVAVRLGGRRGRAWAPALAFPLGAGLTTWIVFILSWIGLPLDGMVYFGVLAFLALFAWGPRVIGVRRARVPKGSRDEAGARRRPPELDIVFLAVGILLLLTASGISIGRSYSTFDDIANWALKGYGLAHEGSIFGGGDWGGHSLEYPQNVPLLIAFFKLVDGDAIPGSKIAFVLYFASLVLGVAIFWKGRGVSRPLVGIGSIFLLSVPVLYRHATLGFVDLPMTTFLVLGLLAGLVAVRERITSLAAISGLLLGLSAWTRVEGAAFAFAVAAMLVVTAGAGRWARTSLAYLGVPLVVIVVPWLAFYGIHGAGGASRAGLQVLTGLRPEQAQAIAGGLELILRHVGRQALDLARWGGLVPVASLVLLAGIPGMVKSTNRDSLTIVAYAGLMLMLIVGLFLVIAGIGENLEWWLIDSLDRHLFPGAVMLLVSAIVVADRWSNPGESFDSPVHLAP